MQNYLGLKLLFPFVIIITITNSCKTPAIIATQTIQKADEYNNNRKYNEAIVHYEKYIEIAPTLGVYRNISMEADVYRKLADAYSTKSKFDSSLYYLHKALKIDSVIASNDLEVIEDYRKIGITYGYIGNFNKSINTLKKSLELNKGMDKSQKDIKRLSIADTYLSLSQVYFVIGDFQSARKNIKKAIPIYKKIDNEYLGLLESYLLLGKIRIEQAAISEGLELIRHSIKIADDNQLNTARHYQAIGSAYLHTNDYEEALKNSVKALNKANESKIIPQIVWMNVKVGDVYSYIGDSKKAESYYETALSINVSNATKVTGLTPSIQMRLGDLQQAYTIFVKSGSLMGTALASLRLGEINENNNNPDKAEYYFYKSDSIFKIIGSKEGQANAKLALCRVFINNNKLIDANKLINQIKKLSKNLETKWQLFFEIGRIHEKQDKIDSAYLAYSNAIDIIEKIRGQLNIEEFRSTYTTNKIYVYERLIMLLIENSKVGAFRNLESSPIVMAFNYSERAKARSFLDILGNDKINYKKPADSLLLKKEFDIRLQIQKVSKEIQKSGFSFDDTDELENSLELLRKEYDKTLDIIKLSNSDYSSLVSIEPPKLSEIQKLIPNKSAIIEYWIGKQQFVVWVISNKNIIVKTIKTGEKDIEELVAKCRTLIKPYTEKDYEKILVELYNVLFAPIEKEISKYKSLNIIPHRSLHFLPFHALVNKEGNYLIEQFNISYAPSSSVYNHCSSKKYQGKNSLLGMALGDVFLGEFSGLPGTKIEVNQIEQLYPGSTTKIENETSESYFKNEAQNFNILHIATHGILNKKHPMQSYLLMLPDKINDGQLSVSEILKLNLKSKFIALSACETGLGQLSDGDELVGLSRAFIYAGTPAIIVSLWPVDDASTALLMTRLHQYYSAGYKLQDAMSFAQRDLINNNFTSSIVRGTSTLVWDKALEYEIKSSNKAKRKNPFFWAPFILIGYGE